MTLQVDRAEAFSPEVLQEYITLRNWWYGKRHGIDRDLAQEDPFDCTSHIVLATDGQHCLGGVRATVSSPAAPQKLPMEVLCPDLRLAASFPNLDLAAQPYVEFSKLVVARQDGAVSFRNDVARRMFRFLWIENNPRPDVRYGFSLAPEVSSRIYRALADAHGVAWEVGPFPPELLPSYLAAVGRFTLQAYVLPRK